MLNKVILNYNDMETNVKGIRFTPTICVTHNCNLNCVYCYQKQHDTAKLTIDTAKDIIDRIFDNIPDNTSDVEIIFFGGEPLLEFDLIKEIVAYTNSKKRECKYIFLAPTNGTVLSEETKEWFTANKDNFILVLSIDGTKETHNYNRCNSFDKIDIDFFLKNWSYQDIKMTLSEYSLPRLAENIKFLHSKGFKRIGGVNLAEGTFDWSNDDYIKILVQQLKELVDFYVDNDVLVLDKMLNKQLCLCESKKERRKLCGIGTECPFFDVDGKMYPCSFITPMTFSENELSEILKTNFSDDENFIDENCFENCYIYPLCSTCAGANYQNTKSFNTRDKSRCKIQKLISLFVADLQAKRIMKNPKIYNDEELYHTIEAIKKIRSLYLPEFEKYL